MNGREERIGDRFPAKGHELELWVEAETLERQRKKADATLRKPAGTTFTLYCDEGSYLNGEDTAPPPLSFLSSAIAF